MGRYYYGDIEGKFWFGLQNSDAADRFGVAGQEPNYIEYYFTRDNLKDVEEELEYIKKELGVHLIGMLEQWFETAKVSDYGSLEEYLNMDKNQTLYVVSLYADYILGVKIADHIKNKGECSFTAEL